MTILMPNSNKPTNTTRSEYQFKFDDEFSIHDDIEVLKRMGLLLGECKCQFSYTVHSTHLRCVPRAQAWTPATARTTTSSAPKRWCPRRSRSLSSVSAAWVLFGAAPHTLSTRLKQLSHRLRSRQRGVPVVRRCGRGAVQRGEHHHENGTDVRRGGAAGR